MSKTNWPAVGSISAVAGTLLFWIVVFIVSVIAFGGCVSGITAVEPACEWRAEWDGSGYVWRLVDSDPDGKFPCEGVGTGKMGE